MNARPDVAGWFVADGYELLFNTNRIRPCPRFHAICGTSTIALHSIDDLPESMSDADDPSAPDRYLIRSQHEQFIEVMAAKGREARPLPFRGAVYTINTGDNLSVSASPPSYKRRLIRGVLRPKSPDQQVRREFAMDWLETPTPSSR